MQFRDFSTYTINDDDENRMHLQCNERYYAPSEITFMLKMLDFQNGEVFGGVVGEFSRNTKLETNHYELLVVAEK